MASRPPQHRNGVDALPPGVLAHILHYLPQQQRLQSCALVSTAWAAAAAAATTEIEFRFPATTRAGGSKAVLRWAGKHAPHASVLRLLGHDKGTQVPFSKLALPGLRCLTIEGLGLPPVDTSAAGAALAAAPAAEGAAAPLAAADARPVHVLLACAHLTRLELRCYVVSGLPALTALTLLSQLRHLRLSVDSPQMRMDAETMSAEQRRRCTLPEGLWEGLAGLTHLDIGQQERVDAATVAQLTHLSGLQELLLHAADLTAAHLSPLQALPALTSLCICSARGIHFAVSANATRSQQAAAVAAAAAGRDAAAAGSSTLLAKLPNLLHLALLDCSGCVFDPDILPTLPKLRSLQLQPLFDKGAVSGGRQALLSALSQCTSLTELRLSRMHLSWTHPGARPRPAPPTGPPLQRADASGAGGSQDPEALSVLSHAALVASPALQWLELVECSVPEGTWQQLFAGGRQLLGLRRLGLDNVTGALKQTDLESLVDCCPQLTALTLVRALQYKVTLHPLLRLSGLLQLRHLGAGFEPTVMRQLTGLHSLEAGDATMPVAARTLSQLTVLTQLTSLRGRVHANNTSGQWSRDFQYTTQVPPRLVPDVWSQLLADLAANAPIQQ